MPAIRFLDPDVFACWKAFKGIRRGEASVIQGINVLKNPATA